LRSNFLGTHFTVYDNGYRVGKGAKGEDDEEEADEAADGASAFVAASHPRCELAAVIYVGDRVAEYCLGCSVVPRELTPWR
jgi:hypothetical protein